MKAYLQHNTSGLYYQDNEHWVENSRDARDFTTVRDAEDFCATLHLVEVHTVSRIDPALITRLAVRAPGVYQAGE
jgi:hypothetical protein